MNVPVFLARKVRHAPEGSFSATVTRIGIGSIALGLAILIVAFAVLYGFKHTIQQKIFLFGAHLGVSKFTNNMSYEETALPLRSRLYDDSTKIPGVRHIQAVALKAGILKTKEELSGVILKGVGRDYDWNLFQGSLVAGKIPVVGADTGSGSTQLLLSQYMANQLGVSVGESVPLYFLGNAPRARKMTVVGIYDTGLEEVDKTIALGDIRLIQRLNRWGPDSVGSYEIFVNDFARLDQTAANVFQALSPDMRLTRVTDQYRPLFDWMLLLDRNMVILLSLITFIASFNMISVLLVLMMERTPMIGLLKALGAANPLIRRMFVFVGLNMVSWGLLIGNVVGLGLCYLQDRFKLIPLDPKNYFMNYVPIVWDWPTILALNGGTILLIALVLWFPTFIINRIQPVKALAFKK
ncbi:MULTISPECIES: FtsX-like permease family protein [unclassified Spirosoma]|uniref:ABC transporter permease n=1 Tax=unclassified Spirosoma TaxID=2621999 RepID=UPI00095B1976|nr:MULTISPECIES: FtsX-like permease family protein [unclassified Spirosoma]MBN8825569.1 ABC transporter permease [Spirosoma sp.]OJW74184.1 MAG: ABC transporter permease [Spirosoma sp. 48-14]